LPHWHSVSESLRSELIEAATKRDIQACDHTAFKLYGLSHEEKSGLGGNWD